MRTTSRVAKPKPTHWPMRVRRSVLGSGGSSNGIRGRSIGAAGAATAFRVQSVADDQPTTDPRRLGGRLAPTRCATPSRPSISGRRRPPRRSAVIVGGVALVITGVGVIALALTIGARFGGDPPPDVARLRGPAADRRRRRSAPRRRPHGRRACGDRRCPRCAAADRHPVGVHGRDVGAAGAVLVMVNPPADTVLAIALTVATMVYGIAALLLLRPHR